MFSHVGLCAPHLPLFLQVESVREQSADQVKRILQLEEKERMLATVEAHLASFKQQAAQLEEQLLQEQRNNDRLDFEAKKAREERDRLAADKQVGGGGGRAQNAMTCR